MYVVASKTDLYGSLGVLKHPLQTIVIERLSFMMAKGLRFVSWIDIVNLHMPSRSYKSKYLIMLQDIASSLCVHTIMCG